MKDGRYKYEFTNFLHEGKGEYVSGIMAKTDFGLITTDEDDPTPPTKSKGWNTKVWNDIKAQVDLHMNP